MNNPETQSVVVIDDHPLIRKGLQQLSEEGSTQVFSPLNSPDLIVGAVGQLQFDVVAYRLRQTPVRVAAALGTLAVVTPSATGRPTPVASK